MLGKENHSPISVKTSRASIPCNPNTIFDVGLMANPVYIVGEPTKPKDNDGSTTPQLEIPDERDDSIKL